MTGVVVWITGLPSSGKSTLAERVFQALRARGAATCVLDGDDVRSCLVPSPGYSEAERETFYESLAKLAALIARQGLIVLVPATAHRRLFRERARAAAPAFCEVWMATSRSECEKRDAKGLYAKARAGELHGVPGFDEPFEEPVTPDIVVRGSEVATDVESVCAQALRARDL